LMRNGGNLGLKERKFFGKVTSTSQNILINCCYLRVAG
jgi:hypothetical protein